MKKEENLNSTKTQALNMSIFRERFIELNRDNLVKYKRNLPIEEISLSHFKSTAISIDEIHKAEIIIFKEGEEIKVLKNRYNIMQHSVKEIGRRYSDISAKRKDKKLFKYDDFIEFARKNKNKYSLIKNGDDLLVSTWYSNDLIDDYKNSI